MTVDTVATDVRTSPLASWREEFEALPGAVRLRELPFLTQLSLRVAPGSAAADEVGAVLGTALPDQPCTSARAGDVEVLWLGPDEWLVVAPDGSEELEGKLRAAVAGAGAVVDTSAQRTTLHLTGTKARELLAHGCSIDLHPSVNHAGSCVMTHLAKAGVLLQTRSDAADDYWVMVRSSFAGYLAAWLVDACHGHRRDPQWQ
ncbi:MAG TPA: sarcosine oxidase subunit gamma family protein [Segeticoccus sp.]|uniref:sarcosine oxidase subunit gamma n=1 Tax=Segeticoccus sp. TaxID=2706531 RepID=UPI002D7E7E9A|nr:sarcosine oxidase subunit gamma family protein [Segeticoccus sp.]HET8601910.1 sarcosine oxidase subunit gamma family protein [Segeticoccus sp.]